MHFPPFSWINNFSSSGFRPATDFYEPKSSIFITRYFSDLQILEPRDYQAHQPQCDAAPLSPPLMRRPPPNRGLHMRSHHLYHHQVRYGPPMHFSHIQQQQQHRAYQQHLRQQQQFYNHVSMRAYPSPQAPPPPPQPPPIQQPQTQPQTQVLSPVSEENCSSSPVNLLLDDIDEAYLYSAVSPASVGGLGSASTATSASTQRHSPPSPLPLF